MSCTCEHTVQTDGSGQLDRYLKALDPNYAPIDGREIKDLLVHAKKYAGQIRFYDLPGEGLADGIPEEKVSWREFFRRDVSVIAASIGTMNIGHMKTEYDGLRAALDENPDAHSLSALFRPILNIASNLEQWLEISLPGKPVHQDMLLAINSNLSAQLQKLRAIAGGYVVVDAGTQLSIDTSNIKNPALWGLDQTIDPDLSVYEGATDTDKIRSAALYIDSVFLAFYGYLTGLIERSEGFLTASLEDYPSHQPHMALFIAFLKLFAILQEQMNGLTERMLNYYYRDVLRLVEKPSLPDKVHMVFELAKGVGQYRIVKDTELDGGKDASGMDQIYKTADELVVNEAKVVELKTLFIEKQSDGDGNSGIREIHARPVANSLDGHGKPFEDDQPKWDTFGRGRRSGREPKHICEAMSQIKDEFLAKNEAALGFAVASPQLVMHGGNRWIRYQVSNLGRLFQYADILPPDLQIKLTTEEGWLNMTQRIVPGSFEKLKSEINAGRFINDDPNLKTGYYIEEDALYIYLTPDVAPVVPYDPAVHDNGFITPYPVMQVVFGPKVNQLENTFKSLQFDRASLMVKVGSINQGDWSTPNMDGLTDLYLQNDTGAIDPDKAFDPFTAYPNKGKSLIIGSNEIFNKPLKALSVNVELARGDSFSLPKLGLAVVNFSNESAGVTLSAASNPAMPFKLNARVGRQWIPLTQQNGTDFDENNLTRNVLIQNGNPYPLERNPITYNTAYNRNTAKGFLEIEWNIPFSGSGNVSSFQIMQEVAEVFKVKNISVSYESELQQLDKGVDQFFHVYPFGAVEALIPSEPPADMKRRNTYNTVRFEELKQFEQIDLTKNKLLVNANKRLLPQFSYMNAYGEQSGTSKAGYEIKKQLDRDNIREEENLLRRLAMEASGINDTLGIGINQYSGSVQEEGNLYIGLENLHPLQTLTLLFQFAEGSAQDEDNDPPEIHWSYLSNNEWRPLPDTQLVSDGTFGFQTTGIVKINIPKDATNNNTIVTTGLHWLKASVTENSHRIPKLVDVVAQAVVAAFDDRENDPSHFACPLPAESIGKLVVGRSEVKKVQQPFASWDGKAKQQGKDFYTPVSERLRHKSRAITAWDYEHLILDRFPSIYKVKALTHTDSNCLCRDNEIEIKNWESIKINSMQNGFFDQTDVVARVQQLYDYPKNLMIEVRAINSPGNPDFVKETADGIVFLLKEKGGFTGDNFAPIVTTEGEANSIEIRYSSPKVKTVCCGPQIAPGHVLVIPIADFKNRNAVDPLQPKTSRRTLLEIEAYLKQKASPFVKIHAKNPVYEPIMVFFRVRFYEGLDRGYYLKQLNEELVHYLTPWAFDAQADVRFDQKIYASSIINFIEEREYVDFIKDFFMGVCKEECCREERPIRPIPNLKQDKDNELKVVGSDFNLSGQILDAHTDLPIPNVNVEVNGTSQGTQTDFDGIFTLLLEDKSDINLNFLGYKPKTLTTDKDKNWTIYLYPEVPGEGPESMSKALVARVPEEMDLAAERNKDINLEELFSRFCGCADVEKQLSNQDFIGETVITPSTNRSILVSVPKHLIIPCEEEKPPSRCEQRKLQQQQYTEEVEWERLRPDIQSGPIADWQHLLEGRFTGTLATTATATASTLEAANIAAKAASAAKAISAKTRTVSKGSTSRAKKTGTTTKRAAGTRTTRTSKPRSTAKSTTDSKGSTPKAKKTGTTTKRAAGTRTRKAATTKTTPTRTSAKKTASAAKTTATRSTKTNAKKTTSGTKNTRTGTSNKK